MTKKRGKKKSWQAERLSANHARMMRMLTAAAGGAAFFDTSAATNDPALAKHFASADGGSADAHADPETRKTIRERARFEFANNPYVLGIVRTHVNTVIGTGPKLHINAELAGISDEVADNIHRAWQSWAEASKFIDRLRMLYQSAIVDGEGIAILSTNERQLHPVKLAWKLVECDLLTAPFGADFDDTKHVDGIDIDDFGQPLRYHFLRRHPGSSLGAIPGLDHAPPVDAEFVIHLFDRTRPGQHRGVSRIQAMLAPASLFRQFTMAVVKAAHRAASLAFVVQTDHQADDDPVSCTPFDTIDVPDDAGIALPDAWKAHQLKPEQPVTTYPEFKREMISEMGRVLGMPRNKAAADSSSYNYASGRLDHQDHGMLTRVEHALIECEATNPTLRVWALEAVLRDADEFLSPESRAVLNEWIMRPEGFPPHEWHWDQPEHADPVKEASAAQIRLQNMTTTLADEWAKKSQDWRRKVEQIAIEKAKLEELGLTTAQAAPPSSEGPEEDEEEDEGAEPENQEDEEEEDEDAVAQRR